MEAVACRVEGVGLRLAIAIVHRFQAVQLVIAVLLGATGTACRGDLVGQSLSGEIQSVGVLHQCALLPLPLRVLGVKSVLDLLQPAVARRHRSGGGGIVAIVGLTVTDGIATGVEDLVEAHRCSHLVQGIVHPPALIICDVVERSPEAVGLVLGQHTVDRVVAQVRPGYR